MVKLIIIVFAVFIVVTACEMPPQQPREITIEPTLIEKETIIREKEIVLREMTETEKAELVNRMLNEAIETEHCDTGDAIIFYRLRDGDWKLECGTNKDINK